VEQEFFQTARPTSLLRRFERPTEIAAMVAFLSSPLSSAINGAALPVDGGVIRSILWRLCEGGRLMSGLYARFEG
jgi:NAD(P)-dependent dehydrogenase (short-subunit alcohol dehydrogenase family)